MSKANIILLLALWALVGIGLLGAFNISYLTYTDEDPCPAIEGIYICYVVLSGYLLMAVAQIAWSSAKYYFFYLGWLPVFIFAISGTALEIMNGETCPKSSAGLPLCYASLLLAVLILILFVIVNNRR